MTIGVRGPADLAAWAESKACGVWRSSRSCSHPGCRDAQRAADVLEALRETGPGQWVLDEATIHLSC